MTPRGGSGLEKGYYLQRPESSLRAHGDRKDDNYPQGLRGLRGSGGGRKRILPLRKNLENRKKMKAQLECLSHHSSKRKQRGTG